MGAPLARHPVKYLIPEGYVGWVQVKFGVPTAPALPLEGRMIVCHFPEDGLLSTSSSVEEGWAKDQYFYYMSDGSTEALKETGWGYGGMVWGSQNSATEEYFYVGTEQQFHDGVSINKIRPF